MIAPLMIVAVPNQYPFHLRSFYQALFYPASCDSYISNISFILHRGCTPCDHHIEELIILNRMADLSLHQLLLPFNNCSADDDLLVVGSVSASLVTNRESRLSTT